MRTQCQRRRVWSARIGAVLLGADIEPRGKVGSITAQGPCPSTTPCRRRSKGKTTLLQVPFG